MKNIKLQFSFKLVAIKVAALSLILASNVFAGGQDRSHHDRDYERYNDYSYDSQFDRRHNKNRHSKKHRRDHRYSNYYSKRRHNKHSHYNRHGRKYYHSDHSYGRRHDNGFQVTYRVTKNKPRKHSRHSHKNSHGKREQTKVVIPLPVVSPLTKEVHRLQRKHLKVASKSLSKLLGI